MNFISASYNTALTLLPLMATYYELTVMRQKRD